MNYDEQVKQLGNAISKSLYDLLAVLGDIDEDDPANEQNEWEITDDEGGTIKLAYEPKTKQLTITRNGLKLSVNKAEPQPRRKVRIVMKSQD